MDDRQCKAEVFRRDQYRYTGRGVSGFEMHYAAGQCSRAAIDVRGYCRQHAAQLPYVVDVRFICEDFNDMPESLL